MSINKRIYELGTDAHASLWNLSFGSGIDSLDCGVDNKDLIKFKKTFPMRLQTISIPTVSLNTFTIKHKGISVDKPIGLPEWGQELSMDVRLDSNWLIYDVLHAWRHMASDYVNQKSIDMANINGAYGITIRVDRKDLQGKNQGGWTFYNVFVKQVPEISLDYASGDPIVVSIMFGFSHLKNGRI